MFTSSLPCRKDQFAVLYFLQVIIVLIQVYNWEIRHHSTVCHLYGLAAEKSWVQVSPSPLTSTSVSVLGLSIKLKPAVLLNSGEFWGETADQNRGGFEHMQMTKSVILFRHESLCVRFLRYSDRKSTNGTVIWKDNRLIIPVITGAQPSPKAGTGLKMQTVRFYRGPAFSEGGNRS